MRIRFHPANKGKRDFYNFDPRKLKVEDGYNVRDMNSKETREHIAALKASIAENGVRVPLEVRMEDDDIYVVAGHCRLAAVMELIRERHDIDSIPCVPEAKGTNEEERTLNLLVSNSGKALGPLEIAQVVKRLSDLGWDEKKIAARIGWKSPASVRQHLDMLGMPADVRRMVSKGDVSATTALKTVKAHGTEAAGVLREAKGSAEAEGKTKVTPKRVSHARPEPKPEPEETRGALDKVVQTAMQSAMTPPPRLDRERQEIIAALEPFAQWTALNGIDKRKDTELVSFTVGDIRKSVALWRKLTGAEEPAVQPESAAA